MKASRIALLASGNPRRRLSRLLRLGATVADYDATKGITGTTNASAWANQIGIAGPLLQASGAAQPSIEADGSLLFDGSAQFMKAAPFALVQPETIYIVVKQVTWTTADRVFDGNILNSGALYQTDVTPTVDTFAGSSGGGNTNLALNTYGVGTIVFNGASSSQKWNGTPAVTGNSGAAGMGGFTLAAAGSNLLFGNIQVKRVIIRNVFDSAATQAQIQSLLKAIYGTP